MRRATGLGLEVFACGVNGGDQFWRLAQLFECAGGGLQLAETWPTT